MKTVLIVVLVAALVGLGVYTWSLSQKPAAATTNGNKLAEAIGRAAARLTAGGTAYRPGTLPETASDADIYASLQRYGTG